MTGHDETIAMSRKNKAAASKRQQRRVFTTLDDLSRQAQKLAAGLSKLRQRKHPLKVRRGVRKGLKGMKKRENSQQIRAGSRTYFLDVEKTIEGKLYLRITESRYQGEDKKRERSSIVVFPEEADKFQEAMTEMTGKLK